MSADECLWMPLDAFWMPSGCWWECCSTSPSCP